MKYSSERGSIMLLGIGFIGVCLLALAVVTDASSAFIQQRNPVFLARPPSPEVRFATIETSPLLKALYITTSHYYIMRQKRAPLPREL
jgi:Na+-transporting methylmalonyl-CoA/oxaloacetate decarboxylase gamma subunit